MRILLQFPEGLKKDAIKYAAKYEKEGHSVIISAEPSYGACGVVSIFQKDGIKYDKIIHFGHVKFCNIDGVDVEYVPVYAYVDVKPVMKKALEKISKYTKIGIVTNLSHVKQVEEIKNMLQNNGKIPITAKGSARCCGNEAQILGCDMSALNSIKDRVECIIYFGSGMFHAFAPGAMENYELPPMLWVDPYSRSAEWVDEKIRRMQKIRRIALMKASEANVFGILVSVKVGQYAMETAENVKMKIEKKGKRAFIIMGDTFNFDSLNNFTEIECFVNTACPRIADDQNKLRKPIVNAKEMLEII